MDDEDDDGSYRHSYHHQQQQQQFHHQLLYSSPCQQYQSQHHQIGFELQQLSKEENDNNEDDEFDGLEEYGDYEQQHEQACLHHRIQIQSQSHSRHSIYQHHPLGKTQLCVPKPLQPARVETVKHSLRDDWNDAATYALLEAWGRKFLQMRRGSLKLEDWARVAETVSAVSKCYKTDIQCKNWLDTLKKKFKLEKQKQSAIGSSGSEWPFYKHLEWLLNNAPERAGLPGAVDAGQMVRTTANEKYFSGGWKLRVFSDTYTGSKSRQSPDIVCSTTPSAVNGDHCCKKRKCLEAPLRTLVKAITRFAELYENMERTKQQQLMDLERIRMDFTKDLELQRMQLFMEAQLELARIKHGNIDFEASLSKAA